MSYVTENLMRDEVVLHQAKLHWIIFAGPVICLGFGFYLIATLGSDASGIGGVFIMLGIIAGIAQAIVYNTSEFAVTNRRVLVKVGLIRRRSLEVNLPKVEGIEVHQGILGRLLDFGTVVVRGTGGSKEPFKKIADPLALRHAVQSQFAETPQ